MYMQQRQLTHRLNHLTHRPSTTPTTGHVTKETRVSHSCKQQPGRQRDSSSKRTQVELTTASIQPQLPHATMKCKSSFFFFLFFFCFYTLYLYKQYTNWLPHDKLTTTTSSRNSNSNRMPATAGTTVTRIPAADAAAEVVAAAAAATWVLFIYFFFLKFFFFWQLRASNSRLKVARRLYSVWCFGFYFFSPFYFCPLN